MWAWKEPEIAKPPEQVRQFGLIGFPLEHSFSPGWFARFFEKEKINAAYKAYPLGNIDELPQLLQKVPNLEGLNVTIPYKVSVLPFLDDISKNAGKIGAVNTILIQNGKLTGHNTDVTGFVKSLSFHLHEGIRKALILGTGGSSLAIAHGLSLLGIDFLKVSRNPKDGAIHYSEITSQLLDKYRLIVNTTPAGMFPNLNEEPPFPTGLLHSGHLVFDLIYNPEETLLLQKAKNRGAKTVNGLAMLEFQAMAAWEIWNSGKP